MRKTVRQLAGELLEELSGMNQDLERLDRAASELVEASEDFAEAIESLENTVHGRR